MAVIKPFKAYRYNENLTPNIGELTSPLFDVVSEAERQRLYENPLNSIHLSVPPGNYPAERALDTLHNWKKDRILVQDELPAIYPYYQYFTLPNSPKAYCRKGFICHIQAHRWEEKQVLRHENTMPGSVGDRLALLEKTQFHTSPVHGLYADAAFELEKYLDEALLAPLYETEDYQGVREVVGVIEDDAIIRLFIEKIQNLIVILADGHHRYESVLQLQEKTGTPLSLPIYLTNIRANDICILPTHRQVLDLPAFDKNLFLTRLEPYFTIKRTDNFYNIDELISGKRWTFGLVFTNEAYKITLRPEAWQEMTWQFPEQIRELDLTVLHYFVIEKALGIPGKVQRESKHLGFSRSLPECLAKVQSGEIQLALITQSVTIEQVEKVCESGYVMPQKSTYFYPKALCGFFFSSLHGM